MKENYKYILLLFSVIIFTATIHAQDKFYTKNGTIEFYSKAPLEDIKAVNRTVTAVLDSKSGALQFSVVMKGFQFKKALMQEHFNDNYVESHKYPKGIFSGSIVNNNEIKYENEGTYPASVKGKLTIHGITRDIETSGKIRVVGNNLFIQSQFMIKLSDYNIKIPALVKDNISNNIRIDVNCKLEPLKK